MNQQRYSIKSFKRPSESVTVKTEVVCSADTNPLGLLKGGRLVEWMDMAAAVCAQTHAGKICVTASVNHIDFLNSAQTGDIITITAKITRAFTTSMEIMVLTFARKVSSRKKILVSQAYFIFVAIDDKRNAIPVINLKPVTAAEKRQYSAALNRKKAVAKVNFQQNTFQHEKAV